MDDGRQPMREEDEEEEAEDCLMEGGAPRRPFQLEQWGSILADSLAAAEAEAAAGGGDEDPDSMSPSLSPDGGGPSSVAAAYSPLGLRSVHHCRPVLSRRRSLEEMGGGGLAGGKVKRRSLDSEDLYGRHVAKPAGSATGGRSLAMDGEWAKYGGGGDLVAEPNFWLQSLKVRDASKEGAERDGAVSSERRKPLLEVAGLGLRKLAHALPHGTEEAAATRRAAGGSPRRTGSEGRELGRFAKALRLLRYGPAPLASQTPVTARAEEAGHRLGEAARSASQDADICSVASATASGVSGSSAGGGRVRRRVSLPAAGSGSRAGGSAGHGVQIPDSWHGEKELQEWVDWKPVENALRPPGLMVARAAMMHGSAASAPAAAAAGGAVGEGGVRGRGVGSTAAPQMLTVAQS